MQRNRINCRAVLIAGCAMLSAASAFPQKAGTKSAPAIATARAEILHGQLEPAEKKLWTVLSADPDQPEALTLLAIIRGRQKRYAEAEALCRRALQLDPASLVAHRNLASALVGQDKPDAALEEYKEVVKLAPRDTSARVELARLHLAHGEFAESLSDLNGIPKEKFPPEAIPVKAASLLGVGRKEEAAALIPQVKQTPRLAAELAEVFLEGNAPQYAMELIDAALAASHPAPARLYYLKGRALQATGNSPAALTSLRQALVRDPKFVDTLVMMAAIEASRNEHAKSVDFLKRADTVQPGSPAILRPLVVEGIKARQYKTALQAAQSLADANPDNLDDLYLAAAAMLEGQDYASASSILEKYVSQRPEDSKGFLGLGIAQLALQHYAEATKALERSRDLDPKLADAEYQLGNVADRTGAPAMAMQHFEHAVQLQPQHSKALASLGEDYLQAGELEKAEAVLERSAAVEPNHSKVQYDLALTLSKLGKTEEAKQHMERSRVLKKAEDLGKNPAPVASQR